VELSLEDRPQGSWLDDAAAFADMEKLNLPAGLMAGIVPRDGGLSKLKSLRLQPISEDKLESNPELLRVFEEDIGSLARSTSDSVSLFVDLDYKRQEWFSLMLPDGASDGRLEGRVQCVTQLDLSLYIYHDVYPSPDVFARWLSLFPCLRKVNIMIMFETPEVCNRISIPDYEAGLMEGLPNVSPQNVMVLVS
jgi:hypothetical protein